MGDEPVLKTVFSAKHWIIGVLIAIVIFLLSIFLFGEYLVYGIILGISGGVCIATFFEIDKEWLSPLQQRIIGWAFWVSVLVIVIMFLITIVSYLSHNPAPECPACP